MERPALTISKVSTGTLSDRKVVSEEFFGRRVLARLFVDLKLSNECEEVGCEETAKVVVGQLNELERTTERAHSLSASISDVP